MQASAAANPSANGAQATTVAAAESARTQTGASSAEQMFRYNSFQFIYRQDIGRIVLIGQSPETGERVIQVPSEQVLRAYERTARVERQLARQQSDQSSSSASVRRAEHRHLSRPHLNRRRSSRKRWLLRSVAPTREAVL